VRVRQAKVTLEQARLKLSWTSIHTPVDGYVTNLSLQLGDQAIANQPALALVDVNSFWIDAYFKENQIEGMAVGDKAITQIFHKFKAGDLSRLEVLALALAKRVIIQVKTREKIATLGIMAKARNMNEDLSAAWR